MHAFSYYMPSKAYNIYMNSVRQPVSARHLLARRQPAAAAAMAEDKASARVPPHPTSRTLTLTAAAAAVAAVARNTQP